MVATIERPETSLERIRTGPICELQALPAWLAASFTEGPHHRLSSIRVSPVDEDQVMVESMTATTLCRLQCRGFAQREVWLPGRLITTLRGKHREAHLLAVRQLEGQMVSIRSFAPDSTLAWSVIEPGPSFEQTPDKPAGHETVEARPVRFDPKLLRSVFTQLATLGGIGVALMQESWGLRLTLSAEDLGGQLLLLGLRD